MNKKDTSWGNVADWYNDLLEQSGDSYQEKVILPNILRLLDLKKGQNILDIACGQGYFSRAFVDSGAKVSACDISQELIDIAKKDCHKEIDYKVCPGDRLDYADSSFDMATIVLAIQNIEKLQETVNEAYRVLKVDGRLLIVLNHPAFRIPQGSSWGWDDSNKSQYRRIDSYMSDSKIKIDMKPGSKEKDFTISFHRPLQVYFKALNKVGFVVTKLEEWISHKESQKGPRSDVENRIRKEIPMFLCILARK